MGLWSSNETDYADGIDPTSWSGCQAILQSYITDKQPVKYAQCWVFGGTLTAGKSHPLRDTCTMICEGVKFECPQLYSVVVVGVVAMVTTSYLQIDTSLVSVSICIQ